MQKASFPNNRTGQFVTPGDGGQFAVENTGEGEQIVALVLQCDAHRANPPCILRLTLRQFRDDEIEQNLPGRLGRTSQHQHVVAQPLREHSHVAG